MKLLVLTIVVALAVVTTGLTGMHGFSASNLSRQTADELTDAAYRDGVYVGHLHRRMGMQEHVTYGRWSRAEDRESFIRGYQVGYSESKIK